MGITVISPGILTTVQDKGRFGYQAFGVSASGEMDPRSAATANILVDNEENEAVLECTVMGPQLQFDEDEYIAIAGGDLGPTVDGKPIPNYAAVKVGAGQTLRFTGPKSGCRCYIAFAGGLDIPVIMGSRSTNMKAKIGGFEGRKLGKGDKIGFRAPKSELKNPDLRSMAPEFVPRSEYTLRVILGPQDDMFTDAGVETFLNQSYKVTPEFDRMGCRLDGPVIEHKNGGDIISDGIAFGAVQVPSSGLPIIMLADRQTTGGYTKIATVITADFRILGQLKAGDAVRFQKVSVAAAEEALIAERKSLRLLRRTISGNN